MKTDLRNKQHKFNTWKAHQLIFVYAGAGVVFQLGKLFLSESNANAPVIQRILSTAILLIGAGYLIKLKFKLASVIFIIPLIVQLSKSINYLLHPTPILSWVEPLVEIVNFTCNLIILIFIVKKNY